MIDLKAPPAERTKFQKRFLPPEVTPQNSDVAIHVNKFPLGDIDNFSVARACYAYAANRATGQGWAKWAPWEKAYLDALAGVTFKASGDQVSGVDGAYLAPEDWSRSFFGLLRSISVLDRLPITRITVPARVEKLPRVTNDVTISYPGEATAPTATQFKFGQLTYTARKAMAVINFPNELMRDAPGTVDDVIRQEGAQAIAVDRDAQALTGTGANAPLGLIYNPGVQSYTLNGDVGNGATPNYANDWIQLPNLVANLGNSTLVGTGQAICDGIVGNTRIEKSIHALADNQARPVWPMSLQADGGFAGVPNWPLTGANVIPVNVTKGTSTDTSYLIAGSWRHYALFECLTLAFDSTWEAQGMASDQTQVRIKHRWDAAPLHPEAFVVVSGVRG